MRQKILSFNISGGMKTMPIYDYQCKECNKHYDILHVGKEIIKDIHCPACGSSSYKKLFSMPSIATKGYSANCSMETCGQDRSNCGCKCGCN
jgi:putative FmdB family regulatory protein